MTEKLHNLHNCTGVFWPKQHLWAPLLSLWNVTGMSGNVRWSLGNLVFLITIVGEHFSNKGTPHQLRVSMFDLKPQDNSIVSIRANSKTFLRKYFLENSKYKTITCVLWLSKAWLIPWIFHLTKLCQLLTVHPAAADNHTLLSDGFEWKVNGANFAEEYRQHKPAVHPSKRGHGG